jgi:putative hydrolase of the HAD superfamily
MRGADVRWVVFDYGEVISKRTEAVPALAERVGANPAAFERAYWSVREPWDRGCADLDYWRSVAKAAGLGADRIDGDLSAELTALDGQGWLVTDRDSLALLAELHEAGVALALLSNAPSSFGRVAEQQPWARHFRHLIFSGDLGIAKPDQEIWAALLQRLGADAEQCLFFDDRQVNVDGARRAGLAGQVWPGAIAVRDRLTEFGVLS